GNLLGVFVPLLDAVCTNPARYADPSLITAATLSLAKFMTLSPELCESRLRLLFTVLERSSCPLSEPTPSWPWETSPSDSPTS
ncbi:unnamed protein product, partial [Lampetra fluviatilis]